MGEGGSVVPPGAGDAAARRRFRLAFFFWLFVRADGRTMLVF